MAHIAFQDIDELRQLIDAGAANEPPYRSDAVVVS